MAFSQEELKNLLGDLELNESTLEALTTLIEGHVTAEVAAATQTLTESHEATVAQLKADANRYAEMIKEEVTSKTKEYVDYAVAEFIKENTEKFQTLEENAKIRTAFDAIRAAFETNGFVLNENANLDAVKTEATEAKAAYNALFEELTGVKEKLQLAEMALIFSDATSNLTETQREKVRELSEAVTFDTKETFTTGLGLIVEQVTSAAKTEKSAADEAAAALLTEEVQAGKGKGAKPAQDERMAAWVSGLRKTKP